MTDTADPKVEAPWTQEQVAALNRWQASPYVHPFTCGNRNRDTHPTIAGGDFDAMAWIQHMIKLNNAELDIWRERFPLIKSAVQSEAEERVAANPEAK